jgi:hypothetical protein
MDSESRGKHKSSEKDQPMRFIDIEADRTGYQQAIRPEQRREKPVWSPPVQQGWLRETGVNVLLTLERPPATLLAGCNRGERYRRLMAHARAQREHIIAWATEQGLCDDLIRVGEANSFQLLFIYCTPNAARQLASAPGVVDVAIT